MSERKKTFSGQWVLLILVVISAALVLSARLTRLSDGERPVPVAPVPTPAEPTGKPAAPAAGEPFLDGLSGRTDVREVLKRLDALAAEHPASPRLDQAVREVHGLLGSAFDGCLEPLRRVSESYALSRDDRERLWNRERDLRQNHCDLLGLCLAVRLTNCPKLRRSCWYDFACACLEQGRIERGTEGAFRRDYLLTKIEIRLDYAPQKGAWTREDGFPVNFRCVSFEAAERLCGSRVMNGDEMLLSVGPCKPLDESVNGTWTTVWSGEFVTRATPWQEAAIQLMIRDENEVTADIERRAIVLLEDPSLLAAGGGHVVGTVELHTDRNTGDPNPKVHYRLTVSGQGVDLLSLVPRDRTLSLD